jgi:hypothetical protein
MSYMLGVLASHWAGEKLDAQSARLLYTPGEGTISDDSDDHNRSWNVWFEASGDR